MTYVMNIEINCLYMLFHMYYIIYKNPTKVHKNMHFHQNDQFLCNIFHLFFALRC